MFFEDLENEIASRIVQKVSPSFIVEVLPDDNSSYSRPFDKTKISVCYIESQYNKPKSTGYTAQEEGMNFEIVIVSRNRRGVGGLYDAFNQVRKAIIGYVPANCNRIYAVSFMVMKREDGLFYFTFTVGVISQLVMVADIDNDPLPTILTFTPDDTYYDTLVVNFPTGP